MSRYINVSEDAIKSVFKKLNHKNIYPKVSDEMILRNYLDEFPSADVAPVVHGEWVDRGEDYVLRWTCSNCGRRDTHIYNFCPDCGADMRGGTE